MIGLDFKRTSALTCRVFVGDSEDASCPRSVTEEPGLTNSSSPVWHSSKLLTGLPVVAHPRYRPGTLTSRLLRLTGMGHYLKATILLLGARSERSPLADRPLGTWAGWQVANTSMRHRKTAKRVRVDVLHLKKATHCYRPTGSLREGMDGESIWPTSGQDYLIGKLKVERSLTSIGRMWIGCVWFQLEAGRASADD